MGVEQVQNIGDLRSRFAQADGSRLFVLDFYADWCGPCRFIAPVFEQLSEEFRNASFLKINVDFAKDISMQYGVRAMPTFILVKNSQEVQRIQGADANALKNAVMSHYSEPPANPNAATAQERSFLEQFVAQTQRASCYTDDISKILALSLIPDNIKEQSSINGSTNSILLANGLLEWFKSDFFTWCDSPTCSDCGEVTPRESSSFGTPTFDEKENGATRVEVYRCVCGKQARYPRYNNPVKLLETRKGRCGEWANCFALMAASLDFDIRFVYDITDHVWCELWIPEVSRWVHCDPCEGKLDAPLMYEKGWGKKLSYVIAFGTDHAVDVTWRYSLDFKATIGRRQKVREPVLFNFLTKLSNRMMSNATAERKLELQRRRLRELVGFLRLGPLKNVENYGGRISGDITWRSARSELGSRTNVIIRPTHDEMSRKLFSLTYSCASDTYTRGTETTSGWLTFVHDAKNIMRKKELDWKKSYLCCEEGKSEGEINWLFDLSDLEVKNVKVKLRGAETFEDGSIVITCCNNDVCLRFPSSGELTLDDVTPGMLKITAIFNVGSQENSFQHAQLFRTSLEDTAPQMMIEFQLM